MLRDAPRDAGNDRGIDRSMNIVSVKREWQPLRVAAIGMGWWSDVLADAVVRSGKLELAACFSRSEDKRRAFAEKYRCRAAASYAEILADPAIEAIINTTPNDAHLATTRAAAEAGKHVFL